MPQLKFLPAPDRLDCTLSDDRICLLTDDGSLISIKLAQSLSARGWKVVVLSFPELIVRERLPLPMGIERSALVDMSDEHLKQQLAAIVGNYGSIGAFIHLNPLHTTASTAKAILKQVFLIAKHLTKSLNEAARLGRSWFVTVSRLDGKLGVGQTSDFNPSAGGFFGLTKTLNLEWKNVFCRAIDLDPNLNPEVAVQSILAELYDPNLLITEIGYSSQGRTTLVANQTILPSPNTKCLINQDSVFLVSGGGRGITAQCAIELARFFRCKFILLGRSTMNPEPAYAQGLGNEMELKKRMIKDIAAKGEKPTPVKVKKIIQGIVQGREIQETLSKIEQMGGRAEYISVDITATNIVKEKVREVVGRLGKITGIIHGAGNLADKLIEHKLPEDFEAVYAPKVKGLETLLSCVDVSQINHLVLFSSAAGFFGNIGQSDYAIANEILNKFAYNFKHKHPECRIISFNWGPWDGGMVTPELKQIFAERNVEVIPIELGTQMFVDELAFGNRETVQVLVGGLATPSESLDPKLQSYRIRRLLTLEANPLLTDHMIGGRAVLSTVFALAWMANTGEQVYPGYKFFSWENFKVLKGIVFDETLADEYLVDLQELKKSPDCEIELTATIWSETATGKPRYHYSGQIKLRRQIPPAPTYEAFDSTQERSLIALSPYQNGTLFHGSSFQGVKQILNISPKKLTMECILPQIDEKQPSQIPAQAFNPIAADVQFQCMLIWVRHFYQSGSLPLRCSRGEHFQNIPLGERFYISMEVQASTETKLVANITSHNPQGQVYSRVFGAEVTISKQLIFGRE